MFGNRPVRCALCIAVAAMFCAFVLPQTSHADPVGITTVNFSGSSVCEFASPFSGFCFGAEDVTGSFEFNPATNSIVGSWSFSFSIGFTLSGAPGDQMDQAFVAQVQPNIDNFFFTDGADFIDLDYAIPIAPGALALDGSLQLCGAGPQDCSGGVFTSGIVPEPSTLSVLILGALALFNLYSLRRRSLSA
jgi:hypothetical protein